MSKMRLSEPVQIRIEPPVNGMVHVTVTVGEETIIAAELALDVAHQTIASWLKVLFVKR